MALIPEAWFISSAVVADDTPAPVRERAVARRASSDPALLAAVYSEHGPGIRRFLQGLLYDRAAADDALQETFARAFRRMDTLHDPERIAPWLFGIARNVALETLQAAGVWQTPGWSRFLRILYRDHRAARRSVDALLEHDFDGAIIAHGEPVTHGAKEAVRRTFEFLKA